MDTTLVTVTVLSMGMAAALSAIVWRMLRLERHRSNARVAALTAAVRDTTPHPTREVDDVPIKPAFAEASAGRKQALAGPMFVEHEQASPWGARFAVMVAVAL